MTPAVTRRQGSVYTMSNTLGIDFDADLAEVVSEVGDSFTFDGSDYAAVVSEVQHSADHGDDAGYFDQYDLSILVRTSLFTGVDLPAVGDRLRYGSGVYRVATSDVDADGAFLGLICNEVTR